VPRLAKPNDQTIGQVVKSLSQTVNDPVCDAIGKISIYPCLPGVFEIGIHSQRFANVMGAARMQLGLDHSHSVCLCRL